MNRSLVLKKTNGRCAYCGCEVHIGNMQVDHVIPKSYFLRKSLYTFKRPEWLNHLTDSDMNHIDNLLPSCRVCNKWKSDFTLDYFRHEIYAQVKRLNDYSANYRMAKRYGQVKETPTTIQFYFETIARP